MKLDHAAFVHRHFETVGRPAHLKGDTGRCLLLRVGVGSASPKQTNSGCHGPTGLLRCVRHPCASLLALTAAHPFRGFVRIVKRPLREVFPYVRGASLVFAPWQTSNYFSS